MSYENTGAKQDANSLTKESEEQLQAKCFQWAWNTLPQTRGRLRLIFNNPKNKIQGAHLKAMGLQPGISDHVLFTPVGQPTVFLECKTPTGKQSPAQVEFERMVKGLGHEYYVYRSLEEFKDIILKHYA